MIIKGGGAYKAMMKLFADNLDDEKFVEHCKKFFKGEKKKMRIVIILMR